MTYGIVKKLKQRNETDVLAALSVQVNSTDRKRGKQREFLSHRLTGKKCKSDKFIDQKLEYIHANPCEGYGIWLKKNTSTNIVPQTITKPENKEYIS